MNDGKLIFLVQMGEELGQSSQVSYIEYESHSFRCNLTLSCRHEYFLHIGTGTLSASALALVQISSEFHRFSEGAPPRIFWPFPHKKQGTLQPFG